MPFSTLRIARTTEEFYLRLFELNGNDKSPGNDRIEKCINYHWFNQSIDLVIPNNVIDFDLKIEEIQADRPELFEYFILKSLPVIHLIEPAFVELFVKHGSVSLLSNGTSIDGDDCAAVLPNGRLILHLTDDTYERLEIDGKESVYNTKQRKKYVVTIDLLGPIFKPGSKYYNRVKKALSESYLKFDFFASWIPENKEIHPVSLAEYFKTFGISYREMRTTIDARRQEKVTIPTLNSNWLKDVEDESEEIESLYEWLGAVGCNIVSDGDSDDMDTDDEDYKAVCRCTCTSTTITPCLQTVHISGFIPSPLIHCIYENIRNVTSTKSCDWASITVHGFDHSPISWSDREHGFLTTGMNSYTFLPCKDNRQYLICETGSNDCVINL